MHHCAFINNEFHLLFCQCLTIRAWGSIPANWPCPAGFALLSSLIGCMEQSHQHRGNKSACKLHPQRITSSSWRKMSPKSRGAVELPLEVMGIGKDWWVCSTFCTLSMGEQRLGKHMVLNQHSFYNLQNTVHIKTEYKCTSSQRGNVSCCYVCPTTPFDTICCTE